MDNYIKNLHAKFDHPNLKKPQHSPHRHTPIIYGAKVLYAVEIPTSPPLDSARKIRIQKLVGAIRYYARAVDKNSWYPSASSPSNSPHPPTTQIETCSKSLITFPPIPMMASPTAPATWSLQDTPELSTSMYHKPAATQDLISCSQKTSRYPSITAQSSWLHK